MTRRTKITQVPPGTAVPTAPPKRYKDGSGYVRLRWRVGVDSYVECLEHRVIDGVVVAAGLERHHLNRVRDDNRPENLATLTRAGHLEVHAREHTAEIVALYQSGMTTSQVGRAVGLSAAAVSQQLASVGVPARPSNSYLGLPEVDADLIRQWHSEGVRAAEMSRRTGRSPLYIARTLDRLGLRRFAGGNPNFGRTACPSTPEPDGGQSPTPG